MLSFWKDENPGELTAQTGGDQQQQFLTVASRAKKVRRTTCLLVVLFAAGLLCLLFMIKTATPRQTEAGTADDTEAKIESALSRLTGIKAEIFSKMDGIVRKFYEFSNVQQIKVDELIKNPFARDSFLEALDEPVPDNPVDVAATRRRQAQQLAKDLRLSSIIRSEQDNCCMINNRLCYANDTINGFRVAAINEDSVVLQWGDNQSEPVTIVLKLSQ